MKSIVLKSLRQPKNDQQFENNLDECIFTKCDLKSVRGYEFCYKHFNRNKAKIVENQETNSTTKILLDNYKKSQNIKQNESTLFAENIFSEPNFLTKDLLKRKTLKMSDESKPETDQLSDEDFSDCLDLSEERPLEKLELKTNNQTDYDYFLSNASVYSKKEIVKILESKIRKLDILYKKQLEMIGDQILLKRKEYLTMKDNESKSSFTLQQTTSNKSSINNKNLRRYNALVNYKKQSSQRVYLKKKFSKFSKIEDELVDRISQSCLSCQYNELKSSEGVNSFKNYCTNRPVPLSNFCQKHILNDKNQVLFYNCPGNKRPNNPDAKPCDKVLIESIGLVCPIHFSNKFIESNFDLSEEEEDKIEEIQNEMLDSVSLYCDSNTVQNDEEKLESETTTDTECADSRMKSMIKNVRLISVIKQENLHD